MEACRIIKSLRKVDFSHPTGHYTWEKFRPPLEKILGAPLQSMHADGAQDTLCRALQWAGSTGGSRRIYNSNGTLDNSAIPMCTHFCRKLRLIGMYLTDRFM